MKTILFALAMLFAVACDESVDHTLTCTADNDCPINSTCQSGVCVEVSVCSADSECPGGTCQAGLCRAQAACSLNMYRGGPDGNLAQTPGSSVNLLTYKLGRHGPTAPECVPELLGTAMIIMIVPQKNFVPQVEMKINGENQTRFWLSGSNSLFDDIGWNSYRYDWDGDWVIQTPLGEPVFNTVEVNCTNCDTGMPTGISIFTHVDSYNWRENPTGEALYNQGGTELDRLITFSR